MKNYILFALLFCSLTLMQCTPKTSTVLEAPTVQPTEKPAITAAEKEEMKKELKEEIKKEMAAEAEKEMGINEPKEPVKPEVKPAEVTKPPKPAMMDISTANNILQGAWEWTETVYQIRGIGNQVDSPRMKGYTKTAVFKAGNICEILISGYPAGTYNYTVSAGVDQLFINFRSADGSTKHMEDGPLILEDNRFEVRGGYNDKGGTIRYVRK